MTSGGPLSRDQLEQAFRLLAAQLAREGVVGEVYVFGGAAMVLAYKAREATRDVDALFEPREKIHTAAVEVAESLGLPPWWLNDQATSYLARVRDEAASVLADYPNLRVSAISPEHLLAMKALAARSYADLDDIRSLATWLGLTRVEQVVALCAQVYPDEPLSDRARLAVEDVLEGALERDPSTETLAGQPLPPRSWDHERSETRDPGRGGDGPGLSV